jgi:NADPH-dependent glutamate synthase beta subunit-like oxidoreductase/NAD-dependent dihydropyrimidine dehydrogenase PreA subunit
MTLDAVLIMGGLGLIVGIGLAMASKIFYVYVDPLILKIDDVLPGANCGGCGFPGCSSNAEAIVAGKASPNSCVAAGEDVAEAIAQIMGVSIEAKEPDIALSGCTYGTADADTKYLYDGLGDCRAAALLGGGMKVCNIGCLGFGTCAKACPFDAIVMGPKGLPVINEERCTGCGTCERVCPKNIINLSSVTRRIMREYTSDDCTTPCQRTCPAGIDICEYIHQIQLGDYDRAVQVIKERNPFPTVIGRICPRPCEDECRRKEVDEPVAINFLKRFVADYERQQDQRILPYKAPASGRKVTVVGGGVQGLSTAFFTARLGHETTLYEAADQLGGLLRSAIALERLPQEILDWDIQGILEMGVRGQTGVALGKQISIASLLKRESDAVFLASGGWDSRQVSNIGTAAKSPIPGTWLLLDLLRAISDGAKTLDLTGHVVFVGGGQLALDAARNCIQNGALGVTILMRSEDRRSSMDIGGEVDTIPDGIKIIEHAALTKIWGEDSHLSEVEFNQLTSGETSTIKADNLVLAAGRFPEMIFVKADREAENQATDDITAAGPIRWEGFGPYKQTQFHYEKGIFSQSDVLTDFSAAIKAIGAGRRAAASIQRSLYGIPLELSDRVISPETYIQNVDEVNGVAPSPRRRMPLADAKELAAGYELEKGFSEAQTKEEAARCLQCGLVCYQRLEAQAGEVVQIQAAANS